MIMLKYNTISVMNISNEKSMRGMQLQLQWHKYLYNRSSILGASKTDTTRIIPFHSIPFNLIKFNWILYTYVCGVTKY